MPDEARLSNAEIAERLMRVAQLLAAQKENPYKTKAYRRAAAIIKTAPDSIDELVRGGADLTQYSGIGKSISEAVREIVLNGTLSRLEDLRSQVSTEVAALSEYPRLDPNRVIRIFKTLKISTVAELKEKLANGEIREKLGDRMEQHVRQALTESTEMLLYDTEDLVEAVQNFLLTKCGVKRAEVAGEYRRRIEVIGEISFLIETGDFAAVVANVQRYGGRTELLESGETSAICKLPSGIRLRLQAADKKKWGLALIISTGSKDHLQKLVAVRSNLPELITSGESYPSEAAVYRKLALQFIEPELREGHDEVELGKGRRMPSLISSKDILGELHAHSTSSDGSNSIEEMALAAKARGYEYIGITDHSQSLKIARGVSPEDLWKQIRLIDELNEQLSGIRVLKSAEVDILPDGSLDYPDDLLSELDYTVCSIHSSFRLGRAEQTARLLRAMDNRHFNILGHATGRRLLRRPGYEIDIERVIEHARQNRCFFEINSSPQRLDLSAENARLAREAGVKIAVSTDAHSVHELDFIRWGLDQARRAGLTKASTLNCLGWAELRKIIQR